MIIQERLQRGLWLALGCFLVLLVLIVVGREKLRQAQPANAWKRPLKIHSVFSSPRSSEAWAVGEQGLLLHSQDGGNTWNRPQDIPDLGGLALWDVHFTDESHGFAVGDMGVILATENGGKQWSRKANPDNGRTDLLSVHFPDLGHGPLRGWAVGDRGIILATVNGGEDWIVQAEPKWWQDGLRGVHFIDADHGYAVGDNGSLQTTEDGGKTWHSENNPDSRKNTLNGVYFTDLRHGFAVGNNGTLLEKEGNSPWRRLDPPETQQRHLKAIHFVDHSHGWIVEDNALLATSNGGKKWDFRKGPFNALKLENLYFADANRGIVVGENALWLTSDGGVGEWQPREIRNLSNQTLLAVHFTDSTHGWAVGEKGEILATDDSGKDWRIRAMASGGDLHGVRFADANHGWAVGDNGLILASSDGGAHWNPQPTRDERKRDLHGIYFFDLTHGWAVGRDGVILATEDGGNTWDVQTNPDPNPRYLLSICFIDANFGWAVGQQGIILNTTDGGKVWHTQRSPRQDSETLESVHFPNPTHGWVVGENGRILATADGGNTWNPQENPDQQHSHLYGVHFSGAQSGWAIGDNGTLLTTRDGGNHWERRASPVPENQQTNFKGLFFLNPGQGWIVGDEGSLLATEDKGQHWEPAQYQEPPNWPRWIQLGLRGAAVFAGVLVILILLGLLALNLKPRKAVEEKLVSDRPVRTADQDRLNFAHRAKGLSRFLRNPATMPPLTIAVTGEWGSGKSSLMGLFQEELKKEGYRPVWFNAWHHQKEENFLASLDISIRQQAAPSLVRLFPFLRWPYWLIMAGGFWTTYLTTVLALAILISFFSINWPLKGHTIGLYDLLFDPPLIITDSSLRGLCKDSRFASEWVDKLARKYDYQDTNPYCQALEKSTKEGIRPPATLCATQAGGGPCLFHDRDSLFTAIESSLGMTDSGRLTREQRQAVEEHAEHSNILDIFPNICPWKKRLLDVAYFFTKQMHLLVIVLGTGIFGVAYSVIKDLWTKIEALRLSQEPVGYRQQFEKNFQRYVKTQKDSRLIIFLDDLDRCSQEQVQQVMEAVNFMATAGNCFIIIGMAPKHVLQCVGLQFKEFAEADANASGTSPVESQSRDRYARSYLEKIVNVEVPVPPMRPDQLEQLSVDKDTYQDSPSGAQLDTGGHEPAERQASNWLYQLLDYLKIHMRLIKTYSQRLIINRQHYIPELAKYSGLFLIKLYHLLWKAIPHMYCQSMLIRIYPVIAILIAVHMIYPWFDSAQHAAPPPPVSSKPTSQGDPDTQTTRPLPTVPNGSKSKKDLQPSNLQQNPLIEYTHNPEVPVEPIFLLIIILVLLIFYRPQRPSDDPEFKEAIKNWKKVMAAYNNTPRTLKRFENRLRLFAMFRSVYQEQQNGNYSLNYADLVALGTLHYLNPEWLGALNELRADIKEMATPQEGGEYGANIFQYRHRIPRLADGSPIGPELLSALAKTIPIRSEFDGQSEPQHWPPTAEAVKQFRKIAGDMKII